MSLPRPLARFLITVAIFRDAFRRRREEPFLDDSYLHVGSPREIDIARVMGLHR